MLNFSAGPSQLPLEVINQLQEDFAGYKNASLMEISHRDGRFGDILEEAKYLVKKLYDLKDTHEVLFMHGGASLNFAMIPMNFLEKKAGYIISGIFARRAMQEASKINPNKVCILGSSLDNGFKNLPLITHEKGLDYTYLCSNNTVVGTQFKSFPKESKNLIIDATSDIFSRKLCFDNIALMFAGTQKNAGIAGLACAIIRKDFLQISQKQNLYNMLSFNHYAKHSSMPNTPPTFAIYVSLLVLRWLDNQNGLCAINEINQKKAKLIYDCLDESKGFYQGYASKEDRSIMNVSFTCKLCDLFLANASKEGFLGLRGHKEIGGIRASLYNSLSLKEVECLRDFMQDFAKKYA